MPKGQNDAQDGYLRTKLQHCPGRPVQRHEVLSITKLKCQQRVYFYDQKNRCEEEEHDADPKCDPELFAEFVFVVIWLVSIQQGPGPVVSSRALSLEHFAVLT